MKSKISYVFSFYVDTCHSVYKLYIGIYYINTMKVKVPTIGEYILLIKMSLDDVLLQYLP